MNQELSTQSAARARAGFTLVELLTSMAILGVMMGLLFSVFDQINKAWLQGENRVETFTTARAALDLMSRELAQAVATPAMPNVPGITFYGSTKQIYFVAPLSTARRICQICARSATCLNRRTPATRTI